MKHGDDSSRWEKISSRLEKVRSRANAIKSESERVADDEIILAARAELLARSDSDEGSQAVLDLLVFELGGLKYGIENKFVREVCKLSNLTTIPNAPQFLTGLTNHRGEIITVYDIRSFLSTTRTGLSQLTGAIILGLDKNEFAILADALDRQLTLPLEQIMPLDDSISGEARTYASGITSSLIILNGQTLLDEKRLFITA
jgi:purine-binding chemotaxis protein CheW